MFTYASPGSPLPTPNELGVAAIDGSNISAYVWQKALGLGSLALLDEAPTPPLPTPEVIGAANINASNILPVHWRTALGLKSAAFVESSAFVLAETLGSAAYVPATAFATASGANIDVAAWRTALGSGAAVDGSNINVKAWSTALGLGTAAKLPANTLANVDGGNINVESWKTALGLGALAFLDSALDDSAAIDGANIDPSTWQAALGLGSAALLDADDLALSGGGGLTLELKNASFTPASGYLYAIDTSAEPILVTLPDGISGDRIGFMDALGSSVTTPTGFGLNTLTIEPPSGGTIQGRAGSAGTVILTESESIFFRCLSPGVWRVEQGLVQFGKNLPSSGGGGGLSFETKSASFTPDSGYLYAVDTSSAAISVALPTGIKGDRIGFMDALGSSLKTPTGFGLNSLTISPPAGGTIQGKAGSAGALVLSENESSFLRCLAPGNWRVEQGLAQLAAVLPPSSVGRQLLTDNTFYYVRPDGSDANAGLFNTSEGAFQTVQKAIDSVAMLDLGIYSCTIKLADGIYPGDLTLKVPIGSGQLIIQGNTSNPDSVVIAGAIAGTSFKRATLDSLAISQNVQYASINLRDSTLTLNNITWGPLAKGAYVAADSQTTILFTSGFKISASSEDRGFIADNSSVISFLDDTTVTYVGNPTVGNGGYLHASSVSSIRWINITASGSRQTNQSIKQTYGGQVQAIGAAP